MLWIGFVVVVLDTGTHCLRCSIRALSTSCCRTFRVSVNAILRSWGTLTFDHITYAADAVIVIIDTIGIIVDITYCARWQRSRGLKHEGRIKS